MPMLFISLSPLTSKNIVWLATMLLIDYLAVIIAVVIDFRSGILRARRENQQRTSRRYRQSVEKLSRYLITLLSLSAVDAMLVTAAMLFRSTMGWNIPAFPLLTTIGAVSLSLIEGKSVMENSQRRSDFTSAAASASQLLSNAEIRNLINLLRQLINKN